MLTFGHVPRPTKTCKTVKMLGHELSKLPYLAIFGKNSKFTCLRVRFSTTSEVTIIASVFWTARLPYRSHRVDSFVAVFYISTLNREKCENSKIIFLRGGYPISHTLFHKMITRIRKNVNFVLLFQDTHCTIQGVFCGQKYRFFVI